MKTATTLAAGIALMIALPASGGGAKQDLDKLQGTWKSESYEIGGAKIEGEALESVMAAITIKGDAYEWKAGDEISKGNVKIDGAKKPKHIDFVIHTGDVKIPAWWGVYAVEGNTLKICIAPPIGQRPMDFSTKSVTYGVFTLKKAK